MDESLKEGKELKRANTAKATNSENANPKDSDYQLLDEAMVESAGRVGDCVDTQTETVLP